MTNLAQAWLARSYAHPTQGIFMSGECILVIDDSREIVRHLTERVLPTFGYQTLCAYDGQSGLKMIR